MSLLQEFESKIREADQLDAQLRDIAVDCERRIVELAATHPGRDDPEIRALDERRRQAVEGRRRLRAETSRLRRFLAEERRAVAQNPQPQAEAPEGQGAGGETASQES